MSHNSTPQAVGQHGTDCSPTSPCVPPHCTPPPRTPYVYHPPVRHPRNPAESFIWHEKYFRFVEIDVLAAGRQDLGGVVSGAYRGVGCSGPLQASLLPHRSFNGCSMIDLTVTWLILLRVNVTLYTTTLKHTSLASLPLKTDKLAQLQLFTIKRQRVKRPQFYQIYVISNMLPSISLHNRCTYGRCARHR